MKKEEEPLFVGIVDPVNLRKDLLNSSRIIIGSLKKFEMSRALMIEKDAEFAELRHIVKEIQILNNRLKQILPRTTVKVKSKPVERIVMPERKPEIMKIAMPAVIEEKSRLAALEDELASVEEKLGRME